MKKLGVKLTNSGMFQKAVDRIQKNKTPVSAEPKRVIVFYIIRFAYSAVTGSTETYERSSRFFLNFTTPSIKANNVWSLPIPTFGPGK